MLINPDNIEQKIEDFWFEADIYMISIALKNLIDNAIKFSTNKKAIIETNKSFIKVISKGEPLKMNSLFIQMLFIKRIKEVAVLD